MDHIAEDPIQIPYQWKCPTYQAELYREYFKDPSCHFHEFPSRHGWLITADGTIKVDHQNLSNLDERLASYPDFIQSWLYFGLIRAVVYDDEHQSDWHLDLAQHTNGKLIHSKELPAILEKWLQRETNEADKELKKGRILRLIRAQAALEKSRTVVRKMFSYKEANTEDEDDFEESDEMQYRPEIQPELAAVLMVLGETLNHAKEKIVKWTGSHIKGWYGDTTGGWGTPRLVVKAMHNWCKRTSYVLRCQLRNDAIALIVAYATHIGDNFEEHANCTKESCNAKSEDSQKRYITRHQPDCRHAICQTKRDTTNACNPRKYVKPGANTCNGCNDMIGVPMDKVVDIIKNGKIPLLKYIDGKEGEIGLEVEPYELGKTYATVSHIWSDGYGNEAQNKLWRCQLLYFKQLFEVARKRAALEIDPSGGYNSITGGKDIYFWIDTLVIPVQVEYKEQRTVAIRQIHQVFTQAQCTVVIDNGLAAVRSDALSYETTAMRILASGWMRRLWTLQEAYLSRRLYFAFKNPNTLKSGLTSIDSIESMSSHTLDRESASTLAAGAKKYYHNLLGQNRQARIHLSDSTPSGVLLASVWRATQWRTTSHQEHETLALATLLNLDYRNTAFKNEGLLPKMREDEKIASSNRSRSSSHTNINEDEISQEERKIRRLDEMMRDFLALVDEAGPNTIPPGIIFLPGPRLKIRGFAWAPRSWMLSPKIGYMDDLVMSSMRSPATISRDKGLLVRYPGFLLHAQDQKSIRSRDAHNENKFRFPVDSSLVEWYVVEYMEDGIEDQEWQMGVPSDHKEKSLAIILSRPRPRDLPEIGLLVEIQREIRRQLMDNSPAISFVVHIVCRVQVRRETDSVYATYDYITHSKNPDSFKKFICGEYLQDDQEWYVDGFVNVKENFSTDGLSRNARVNKAEPLNHPIHYDAASTLGADVDGGPKAESITRPATPDSVNTVTQSSTNQEPSIDTEMAQNGGTSSQRSIALPQAETDTNLVNEPRKHATFSYQGDHVEHDPERRPLRRILTALSGMIGALRRSR